MTMSITQLGFTNASMFTQGNVKFLSLDGISFARPVPIGSILRLRSQIMHTTTSPAYPILVVRNLELIFRPALIEVLIACRCQSQCGGREDRP